MVSITLREIDDGNRDAVVALRTTPEQEQFVSPVAVSLAEAVTYAHANPWFRAVFAGEQPVGFVMLRWDVEPDPPSMHGPWFLWKLLIDQRFQRRGYGGQVVRRVAELVRSHGATELLTSYLPGEGGPAGFYAGLGFVPTGEVDETGEHLQRLDLRP